MPHILSINRDLFADICLTCPGYVSKANLPDGALEPITSAAKTGIYYGYARVHLDHKGPEDVGSFGDEDLDVLPMVMSLGWNPFYKNKKLTAVRNNERDG